MPIEPQASHVFKGMGRRLRRARNVVKKYEQVDWSITSYRLNPVIMDRYNRACALILADKLRNS